SLFFSSRRRHTRSKRDWSSDVCSSDLALYQSSRSSLTRTAALRSLHRQCCRCRTNSSRTGSVARALSLRPHRQPLERSSLQCREIGRASCRERVRSGGTEGGGGKERAR